MRVALQLYAAMHRRIGYSDTAVTDDAREESVPCVRSVVKNSISPWD